MKKIKKKERKREAYKEKERDEWMWRKGVAKNSSKRNKK